MRQFSRFTSGIHYVLFLFALSGHLAFVSETNVFAFAVDVGEAPTSSLNLTLAAIKSAEETLLVNIYEMSSPEISLALLQKIQSGVHVEIIEEGNPVGGLSASARDVVSLLSHAMSLMENGDHFYEMTHDAGGKRRFHFDHAKYMVIDNKSVLIGSENYSPTGHPKFGVLGNRGWEVLIHDKKLAHQFTQIFAADSDIRKGDLIDRAIPNDSVLAFVPRNFEHEMTQSAGGEVTSYFRMDASKATVVTSPDTSLTGLVGLLDSAKTSIDLELLSFDSHWGGTERNSPLFDAVLSAARRGVTVRVLLNDERTFARSSSTKLTRNQKTVEALNHFATQNGVNLTGRIANIKAMKVTYIHNKGGLVDDNKTLISSINWNENSVENNRETAVILTSSEINAHYKYLFEKDWNASAQQ